MIIYKRSEWYHLVNIFQMTGSVFPRSMLVAMPCAMLAGFLKYGIDHFESLSFWRDEGSIISNNQAFAGFSFLMGFLVVFRTSEAHHRFWEGTTATHNMRVAWYNAASSLTAFCQYSKADEQDKDRFRQVLVRLFSMLHSTALSELDVTARGTQVEETRGFLFDCIDPLGLDEESIEAIRVANFKVELIFEWLQGLIVSEIDTGVLSIPPPLLTRSFQELGQGMFFLHAAQKIVSVPFPFPYAQTCDCLLLMHWILVPFVTTQWVETWYWCSVFVFIQVFVLWTLLFIAVEVEDPFGADANDLDAQSTQEEFNCQLLGLMEGRGLRIPTLSGRAQTDKIQINSLSAAWKNSGLRKARRQPTWDPRMSLVSYRTSLRESRRKEESDAGTDAVASNSASVVKSGFTSPEGSSHLSRQVSCPSQVSISRSVAALPEERRQSRRASALSNTRSEYNGQVESESVAAQKSVQLHNDIKQAYVQLQIPPLASVFNEDSLSEAHGDIEPLVSPRSNFFNL